LLRTHYVSEQNQKHFLCPQQMLRTRANEETFVLSTMCPQQCVLVCQDLKGYGVARQSKQASKQNCSYMKSTPFPQVQLSWEHFFLFGALV